MEWAKSEDDSLGTESCSILFGHCFTLSVMSSDDSKCPDSEPSSGMFCISWRQMNINKKDES